MKLALETAYTEATQRLQTSLSTLLLDRKQASGASWRTLAIELDYPENKIAFLSDISRNKPSSAKLQPLMELATKLGYDASNDVPELMVIPKGYKGKLTATSTKSKPKRRPAYRPMCSLDSKELVLDLNMTVDEIIRNYYEFAKD